MIAETKNPCKKFCVSGLSFCAYGLRGTNSEKTRIMFVANRADTRLLEQGLYSQIGHEQALAESESGRALDNILKNAGLTMEDVYFTNMVKCIASRGDSQPKREQYEKCSRVLKAQIGSFKPKAIVVCGEFAYRFMFNSASRYLHFESQLCKVLPYENSEALVTYHLSRLERMPVRFRNQVSVFLQSRLS